MRSGERLNERVTVSTTTPTRVVLYSILGGRNWTACAEFTYSPESGIQLLVHDPERGGRLAQSYFDNGVPNEEERRGVTTSEPELFMRTLLLPTRTTAYRWVDESTP
ncbi:hypothetical protein GCM10028864_66700 [Microlunatus parietis]